MRVLSMFGPNLSRMGRRDPYYYGVRTLAEIESEMDKTAAELDATVKHFQSNGEGELIDWLQANQDDADAIVVNPAGLTNYGISLRDALYETGLDLAVIHLSNHLGREPWRRLDVFAEIAHIFMAGTQWQGYLFALQSLRNRYDARLASAGAVLPKPALGELPVVHGRRWADLEIAP